MDLNNRKRFSTFLLSGGQRVKVTPPNGANWYLIMLNIIAGPKPVTIINETYSPNSETPIKNNFVTYDESDPDCREMSFRLSNKEPFQCYLNKKRSCIQFVFASDSKEKLLVEQINKEFISVGCSINPNFPNIFMNEIQRIVKSEHPLTVMSCFFKKYEIRPYFQVNNAKIDQILSDSINFALIQMTEKVISAEISYFIKFLDLKIFLEDDLLLHDAILIERIINLFPRLKSKINHIIIHTKNSFVFLTLLIDKNLFDYTFFCNHLSIPENIDKKIVFKILKFIVDDRIPIYSSLLKLFLPYVQPPLLYTLLSSNKILCDSMVISKKIIDTPIISIKKFIKLQISNPLNYNFALSDNNDNIKKDSTDKNTTERNIVNFRPQHFSPQKQVPKKKLQISHNPDSSFEIIQKKQNSRLKMTTHDHIFLNEKAGKHNSLSLSFNIVDFSYVAKVKCHRERSSKSYKDVMIIVSCTLFAFITILFIWSHFSFYVL